MVTATTLPSNQSGHDRSTYQTTFDATQRKDTDTGSAFVRQVLCIMFVCIKSCASSFVHHVLCIIMFLCILVFCLMYLCVQCILSRRERCLCRLACLVVSCLVLDPTSRTGLRGSARGRVFVVGMGQQPQPGAADGCPQGARFQIRREAR